MKILSYLRIEWKFWKGIRYPILQIIQITILFFLQNNLMKWKEKFIENFHKKEIHILSQRNINFSTFIYQGHRSKCILARAFSNLSGSMVILSRFVANQPDFMIKSAQLMENSNYRFGKGYGYQTWFYTQNI